MTRLEELTLKIKMGWGETTQDNIPDDWMQRKGPDKSMSLEHRMKISASRTKHYRAERLHSVGDAVKQRFELRRQKNRELAARKRAAAI